MVVLVIDDAKVMRNIIGNSIRENFKGEVKILEAPDGISAMKLLTTNSINIAFVDWNMPEMDGLEFVQRVRSLEKYARLPMIMITSEAARYMVVEAVKAGVTDYIVKPIVGKMLWDKIGKYFPEMV
jgi:two-component system chemotaxis response regulator CheY